MGNAPSQLTICVPPNYSAVFPSSQPDLLFNDVRGYQIVWVVRVGIEPTIVPYFFGCLLLNGFEPHLPMPEALYHFRHLTILEKICGVAPLPIQSKDFAQKDLTRSVLFQIANNTF